MNARPPTSRTRPARTAGATLLELLTTLGIMAVLLGTLTPNFAQVTSRFALRAGARHVLATTQGNRHVFRIVSTHAYTLHDDDNGNGIVDPGESFSQVDLQGETGSVTIGGTSPITFLSDGRALAAATVTVRVPGAAAKTLTVSDAGLVKLQ